jgi:hypothetical protein
MKSMAASILPRPAAVPAEDAVNLLSTLCDLAEIVLAKQVVDRLDQQVLNVLVLLYRPELELLGRFRRHMARHKLLPFPDRLRFGF